MKTDVCDWCQTPVKVSDNFDARKDRCWCSIGCRDADALFRHMFSDKEISRRHYYDELTKGDDDGS